MAWQEYPATAVHSHINYPRLKQQEQELQPKQGAGIGVGVHANYSLIPEAYRNARYMYSAGTVSRFTWVMDKHFIQAMPFVYAL